MQTLGRVLHSFVAGGIALIPFWVWLAILALTSPQGFWEKLFVIGMGVWFLGLIQLGFLAALVAYLLFVVWDHS